MNREILFRGKRIDNGEWVFGYFVKRNEVPIIWGNVDSQQSWWVVDEDTVCQYTGLKDENDNRIFEGDIVCIVYDGIINPNYVVVWDSDELDFKATNGKENYYTNYEYITSNDYIEVIGNIFENPELLKGATDEIELKQCPYD